MIIRTYVINLARCNNKREHMKNEFKKLEYLGVKLNHIFFDAIDGNNKEVLSKYKFNVLNWFDPNSGKAMTNGEVGCALSHYFVWKDIVDSVEKKSLSEDCKVLIVEDDVIFLNDFMEKFKTYSSEAELTYDMLYIHRKPLDLENEIKLTPHINIIKKSYWACGYILTYSGAKKLISANYLENLIPVDEFLPIMYGCNVFGFEKYYEHCEKIKCYAICPSLLKLTWDAFNNSETFHSQPFLDNKKFKFGDNKEFITIYIGPTTGHSYKRFIEYCKLYAIPCIPISNDNKQISQMQLLKNELQTWSTDKLESTLFLIISCYPTDHCNIIPVASPSEIINKFIEMTINDYILTNKRDTHNKTFLCGWGKSIIQFTNDCLDGINKSINNDISPSLLLSVNHFIRNNILFDDEYQIFQSLDNTNNIIINQKASRIINSETNSTPCIIFANDINGINYLNKIENYTGNNWNEYYGYKIQETNISTPRIYLSFYLKYNKNILKILDIINYPKELLSVHINKIDGEIDDNSVSVYKNEEELYKTDIINFLNSDCDYYFFIDHNCVLENPMVLRELLNLNKCVVAPLIRLGSEAWTNFWGELNDRGYYKRSFDYFDIINNRKTGCWNVPYITSVYLIKKEILELVPNIFTDNIDMDIDMRMCHNLRQSDIFMYISNMSYYGQIQNVQNQNVQIQNVQIKTEVKNGEVALDDIFDRRLEWEQKYLHPEYYQNKNNLEKLRCIEICNDIYTFPLFSQTFCTELIKRTEEYGKWSKGKNEHNDPRLGKNYYENVPTVDIQLFEIKLDKQWYEIVFSYIAPMARHLYNNYKTKDINLAFVVKYNFQDQSSLSPHHDASTYTVNIALNWGNGVDYDGGGCRFIRQNYVLKNQEPGMCTIHAGRLTAYHEGLPVTAGTRYILVSFIN